MNAAGLSSAAWNADDCHSVRTPASTHSTTCRGPQHTFQGLDVCAHMHAHMRMGMHIAFTLAQGSALGQTRVCEMPGRCWQGSHAHTSMGRQQREAARTMTHVSR